MSSISYRRCIYGVGFGVGVRVVVRMAVGVVIVASTTVPGGTMVVAVGEGVGQLAQGVGEAVTVRTAVGLPATTVATTVIVPMGAGAVG